MDLTGAFPRSLSFPERGEGVGPGGFGGSLGRDTLGTSTQSPSRQLERLFFLEGVARGLYQSP